LPFTILRCCSDEGAKMKTIKFTSILSSILLLFLFTYNAFAKNFVSLCESSIKLKSVIEHHTKVYFPEYVNNKAAFSNLEAKTGEYVKSLCSNVGKRAYHGKWHPKPFDFGKIIGVTYFKKGESLGYPGKYAEADDFYYIIEAYGDVFVSKCNRVDPR
jgi:hypothetical protein